jgi:hypothetical protein
VLGSVVHHDGTLRDGAIEERMGGCCRQRRAEIRPAEENDIVRMRGRIGREARDQEVRLARGDARLRGGKIQAVQRVSPEQQVHVRVDDPRYDGAALEVDDPRMHAPAPRDRGAFADGLDARARDGERVRPRRRLISRIDVAIHQQGVRAERACLPGERDQRRVEASRPDPSHRHPSL